MTTFERSTPPGQSGLTSSPAASLARISVMRARAPDLPEAVRGSGGIWFEPFAWYDRERCLWRTWQRCLVEGWTVYSGTWPRSGMTRNGIAYRRRPLVPLTNGIASGLLPTPNATESKRGAEMLEGISPTGRMPDGSRRQVGLKQYLHHVIKGDWPLVLPTPTVKGDYNRRGLSQKSGDGLMTVLRRHLDGRPLGRKSFRRFREWMMGYPIDWTRPE